MTAADGRPIVAVALSEFAAADRRPLDLLEQRADVRINRLGRRLEREELIALARDAQGIVAGLESYDAATLDALPRLRCIARCGAGVDNVDIPRARERGIAVLNTPLAPTEAVAELALAMILALLRDLVRQNDAMRVRAWRRTPTRLLLGRRLGLIGLGRIGRRLAELLAPFEPVLCGVDPAADPAWCERSGVRLTTLAEALASSEIVTIHAAKDPARPLRLGAAEIATIPRGGILVNVARGGMVDEVALADALRSGHLAGAGLDVFEEEPYRGPLCDLDNVILTPHAATSPVETRIAMEVESVENVLAGIAER